MQGIDAVSQLLDFDLAAAENAFKRCDAMLAVGTRFAEICTGSYGSVPPRQLVHIDINPDALGRNFPAAVPIHADARDAVPALADALDAAIADRDSGSLASAIAADKAAYRDEWLQHGAGERVNPARFFDALRERLDDDAVIVADDGNHTFLTAELMPIRTGGSYVSPTDFNCMGYCVPGTIGAKLAAPDRQVVGIVGDGAFLMTAMESLTAVNNELPVAWFVFNDGELSQISQFQKMMTNRVSASVLPGYDLEGFATATGCRYFRMVRDPELDSVLPSALELTRAGTPALVEVGYRAAMEVMDQLENWGSMAPPTPPSSTDKGFEPRGT